MDWLSQWAPLGATALCAYFIKRFISDTDKFKEETKIEIAKVTSAVSEIQAVSKEFKLEHNYSSKKIEDHLKIIEAHSKSASDSLLLVRKESDLVNTTLNQSVKRISIQEEFLRKMLGYLTDFKKQMGIHEQEIKTVTEKVNETYVFVKNKNKKDEK